jgi:hypothetical protein
MHRRASTLGGGEFAVISQCACLRGKRAESLCARFWRTRARLKQRRGAWRNGVDARSQPLVMRRSLTCSCRPVGVEIFYIMKVRALHKGTLTVSGMTR